MNLLSPSLSSFLIEFFTSSLSSSYLVPKHPSQAFPLFISFGVCFLAFLMAASFSPFKSALQCHFLRTAFLGCSIQVGFSHYFLFQNYFAFFLHRTNLQLLILLLYFSTDLFLLCLSLRKGISTKERSQCDFCTAIFPLPGTAAST